MGDPFDTFDAEFDAGGDIRPYLCEHPSSDGIDDSEGPGKIWRCLTCQTLHYSDGTRIPEPEVEAVFQDFWADIVCPGGRWDLVQVKAELHDYHTCIENVPKVYMDVTGGLLSKPNYLAAAVTAAHHEHCPDVASLVADIRAWRDGFHVGEEWSDRMDDLEEILAGYRESEGTS